MQCINSEIERFILTDVLIIGKDKYKYITKQ